jgi:phosphoserine phosphatase
MYDGKTTVAFDVDDCLIIPSVATGFPTDTPNYDTIAVYKWFQAQGCVMIVWSGGGIDYAKMWAEKLGLEPCYIWKKEANRYVDIAFDDCDVKLAYANVKVKRINNSISREGWNDHEKYGSENN